MKTPSQLYRKLKASKEGLGVLYLLICIVIKLPALAGVLALYYHVI